MTCDPVPPEIRQRAAEIGGVWQRQIRATFDEIGALLREIAAEPAVPEPPDTVTLTAVTLLRSDVELVKTFGPNTSSLKLLSLQERVWNAVFDAATAEPAPPTGTAPTGLQRWDVWLTPEGTRRRVESMDADCGGDEFATFSPGLRQAGSKWVLRKWTLVERPEGTPYPAYRKGGES